MHARSGIIAAGLGIFGVLAACVGDDPNPATPSADGGLPAASTDAGTDTGAAAVDGGPTTCFGQPFERPIAINVSNIGDAGAPTPDVLSLRVVGSNAYFAMRRDSSEVPKLFAGTFKFPSEGGPSLEGAKPLVGGTPPGDGLRAPAVAPDSSFVLFTHGEPGSRNIWAAHADGMNPPYAFTSDGAAIFPIGGDDADVWVAGNPPRAVYWAHGDSSQSAMRVNRARLTPLTEGQVMIDMAAPLGAPCPVGPTDNCAVPVVTPDETMMLFASWVHGPFAPAISEVALTPMPDGKVTPSPTLIDHPELADRAPTWVSANGCEVLLAKSTTADLAYARRTAK